MKRLLQVLAFLYLLPNISLAQDSTKTPDYFLAELTYMKVKIGQEDKFSKAVKAHNEKFHKEGKYSASASIIKTGEEAGWVAWSMGPFTYTDLDGRPNDDAHKQDWNKNVAPYIEQYGRNEIWKWSESMSFWKEGEYKLSQVWFLDIEEGQWDRFSSMMKNIASIHKEKASSIMVYYNQFSQNNGRDIAIVWGLEKWADFDTEDWKMKEAYDEKFGDGSWDLFLEDWRETTKNVKREMWQDL